MFAVIMEFMLSEPFCTCMLLDLKVCTVVVIIFVCPSPRFSRIGGVMVSVLTPSMVGSSPDRVKPMTMKLVLVAFPPSTQY
jgi:hypothetical protein